MDVMKLATTTGDFDLYSDDYLEKVQLVQEAGFRYIDLSLYTVRENDPLIIADNWRETAEKLKCYTKEHGLQFVQSHAPNTNALGGEKEWEKAVKQTIRAVEVCGYLGIPNLVVHSGWDKEATKEEWFERNKAFFSQLFPAMEANKVNVLHENTTSANMPWYYPKTGADMREFSQYVNHPYFHSCWDTGHANIEGPQYQQILDLGDDLYALHINDNRGKQDEHIIPFLGTMNMDEILNALKAIEYQGIFTLESGSSLRPQKYWLGNRYPYEEVQKLANPPLKLQKELERFMYHVGEYILTTYGMFEG